MGALKTPDGRLLSVTKDAAGVWRPTEPHATRLREKIKRNGLHCRMTLNETDGWERIDLHPVDPERFTHLCARFQAERKILQGDTYHSSLRIKK